MAHRDVDEEDLEGEIHKGTYYDGVTPQEKREFEEMLAEARRDRSSKRSKVVRRGVLAKVAKRGMEILFASNARTVRRILQAANDADCPNNKDIGAVSQFEYYHLAPYFSDLVKDVQDKRATELRYACMVKKAAEALQYRTTPKVKKRFEAIGRQAHLVMNGKKSKIQRRFARLTVAALLVAGLLFPEKMNAHIERAIGQLARRNERRSKGTFTDDTTDSS